MNNDRFKFRVWDKKDKEYLDPDYYEGFYLMPDGKVHVGMTVENGLYDEYQVIPPQQLIVEQCTGLKDKNGKLIYEGDVVRLSLDGSDKVDREVYYCEYQSKWFMRLRCSFEWGEEYQYYDFNAEKARELEIIGNIHDGE